MPAIAVADALRDSGALPTFIGTRGRAEADLVPEAGYEIDFVELEGLSRTNPFKAVRALARAARGVGAAKRILRERGAQAVLGGGGYVAGPTGLAATRLGLPLVLTEADSHLGLTNRRLAARARAVCLAFPIEGREGDPYVVTGRPVPRAVLEADRWAARRRFGIPRGDHVITVFCGSLGALTVNESAFEAFGGGVEALASDPVGKPWVLHVAGRRDYPSLEERWAVAGRPERYLLLEYEPSLGDVLAASDLVVARAGGSVMEIAAAGRPAILVPYPDATADHQTTNARWMSSGGAAVTVPDAELDAARLRAEADAILGNEARLQTMTSASHRLAVPDAAKRIAAEVLDAVRAGDAQ
ncbi:undecaprenyldiphospho-muramoylpentapeptide beta-N-acetylglucosaminyltransferase [soil metagenome]